MSEKNKNTYKITKPIMELTNGIVLSSYEKTDQVREKYQTEKELETEMIENLVSQGYQYIKCRNMEDLKANLKVQIESLNKVSFTNSEWNRYLSEYLDRPNDTLIDKTRKIQENHVYTFTFDNGEQKNIKIIDKKDINNNKVQVTNQVSHNGQFKNRYDITILINGLPLVHVELKKRDSFLRQAFDQIHRYSKESFNLTGSLYQYVQIFVISNGTYTKYFANTTAANKNHYEFTCEWADAKNNVINDLVDFTKTFFEKRVLLSILTKYCVFDSNNILLIMRPYQISATERIIWKINSSYTNKKAGSIESGGYIWHTTGSGKTLTSFKTAKIATELDFIDKVLFVVDRKDLDYQTMKEYQKFQPDSVIGSKDTKALKTAIEKDDNKIIVTTIQKLNEFIKKNPNHEVYKKQCVLIFDECHRSQFGEAQKNIKKNFKQYYMFGFTGTPILAENSTNGLTTESIFGARLHSYVIKDAIRDGKVLKFKVDYVNLESKFKEAETPIRQNNELTHNSKLLESPQRIEQIVKHTLRVFNDKTNRNDFRTLERNRQEGFNAMFAVQSVNMAKTYYEKFKELQESLPEEKRLRIATIFSYQPNEESTSGYIGDIGDEAIDSDKLPKTSKEFLYSAISDYDKMFSTNYEASGDFYGYYKDLSNRVKKREIDLLIVVGMFLTGFDSPTLSTLFVDKTLQYHGLIQAYSRTNRIYNDAKKFGNIVCYRDLEEATKEAIKTFGDETSAQIILEHSFKEYVDGYQDVITGKNIVGYKKICEDLVEKFPDPTEIVTEEDKKTFIKLFGELLKIENVLKNYDEFEEFDKKIDAGTYQDMKSVYLELREEFTPSRVSKVDEQEMIDFDGVEFYIDLLKSEDIDLGYIMKLIKEKSNNYTNYDDFVSDIIKIVKSNFTIRSKENLISRYLKKTDLEKLKTEDDVTETFYKFAKEEKDKAIKKVIEEENLNGKAESLIMEFIEKGEVSNIGTKLDGILPNISRRENARYNFKLNLIGKLQEIVDEFEGI